MDWSLYPTMRSAFGWIAMALALLLGWYQPGFGAQPAPLESTGSAPSHTRRLVGTIEGNPAVTRAVFEDPQTRAQKLYGIGDIIDGATIVEIKDHQVWLRRGEQTEVVTITGGSPAQRAPGDSIRVMAYSDDPLQNLQGVLSQVIPPYDRRVEKLRHSLTRDEFDRFVDHYRAADGPPQFVSTIAGPALSVADMDRQTLKQLGLEPTDLIIGVSGMGIDSQERLTQIWDIVSRAKVVDISVLRDNLVKPLYFTIN
ncbi:MAG TPA: hypothetical protein VML36_05765 [Nitrospiria bacterium]|nr:hypothetical protein [Nitrospiria bacterium]